MDINTNKVKFLRNWTLLNAAFFVIGYILALIFTVLMMMFCDISYEEWGSPLQQTMINIGVGILIGTSIGFIQWRLLRKSFHIPSSWIYLVPSGFVLIELIVGIILWKMDLNRGEYSFWEGKPLPHALIFAMDGMAIGLIQLLVLRKYFPRSLFWIVASTVAWGVSILLTAIKDQEIFLLVTFIIGILLYGLITGVSLRWIMKPR